MERLTLKDIIDSEAWAVSYQIGIIGFLIYKITQNIELEYVIVLVACVIGIFVIKRVGSLLKDVIRTKELIRLNTFDRMVTSFGLMIIVGGNALYISVFKGFYGIYLLLEEFTWFLLAYRLLVVFIGVKLIQSVDKLQGGFLALEDQR